MISLRPMKDSLAIRSSLRRIISSTPELDGFAYSGLRMTDVISKSIVSAATVSDYPGLLSQAYIP